MSRLRVKVCGFTRAADVEALAGIDIDAVGFVLWPGSPRATTIAQATALAVHVPRGVIAVGVMVNPTVAEAGQAVTAIGLAELQLHEVADPTPFFALGVPIVWVAPLVDGAVPVPPPGTLLMIDAHDPERHGGTGRTVNWHQAAAIARSTRLVLAGGLTPENVGPAVSLVRPYGVDVSSGVEAAPGLKSIERMRQFVTAARQPIPEIVS